MFHRIKTKPVAFRGVECPHSSADHVGVNVFGYRNAICSVKWMPAPPERRRGRIHVILRIVWVSDKGDFWNRAAESVTKISVDRTRLVCQIDQSSERLV